MEIYDHVDQLSPELIGTVITWKEVITDFKGENPKTSHYTGRLKSYMTVEDRHADNSGKRMVSHGYQVLMEGLPLFSGKDTIDDVSAIK